MLVTVLENVLGISSSLLSRGRTPRKAAPSPPPVGVLLGRSVAFGELGGISGEEVRLTDDERPMHFLVVGPSGFGKSNLIHQIHDYDFDHGRTTILLETLGDGFEKGARRLFARGAKADQVDLIDLRQSEICWPNNYLACGAGDPYTRAAQTLAALEEEAEVKFGVQVAGDSRMALTVNSIAGYGLTEIELLLSPEGDAFRRAVARKLPAFLADSIAAYSALSPELMRQRCAAVANKLTPFLFTPNLQLTFGLPVAFDITSMINTPGKATLINLGEDRQPAAGLLGRLILEAIQREVFCRLDVPQADRNQFSIFLDEFQDIATVGFCRTLCHGRKWGMSACIGHQHFSQIPLVLRDSERANIYTRCFFNTFAGDAREAVSEFTTSLSREEAKGVLMSLPVGSAILCQRGKPSRRIRIPHSPDPVVDPVRFAEFKAEIMARTGIARKDAEAIMAKRRAEIQALSGVRPEIVHERRPKFGGSYE